MYEEVLVVDQVVALLAVEDLVGVLDHEVFLVVGDRVRGGAVHARAVVLRLGWGELGDVPATKCYIATQDIMIVLPN